MGDGIDLPNLAKATGVPHSTLRYWVGVHAILPVAYRDKLALYAVRDLKPFLLTWAERRDAA